MHKLFFLAGLLLFSPGADVSGQAQEVLDVLHHQYDSIIRDAMDSMAFPGAQIMIIHGGIPVYHEAWGYHTYEQTDPVKKDDLYDLASITKVSSGLPVLMKLTGEGKFDLNAPLSVYIPEYRGNRKGKLVVRDILAHQSGMSPYIVYWQKALKKNGRFKKRSFKKAKSKRFSVKITENLFLHRKYHRRILREIKRSPLEKDPSYRYSGLFFQLLPRIIEEIVQQPFVDYLQKNIYDAISIRDLAYRPLERYPKERIIPTEMDTFFRHQLIHGTVHDEAAAMMDGISCNAGLFGTAEALSRLFQFYMDYGKYQSHQLIDSAVVRFFTSYQFPENGNRRGLGFDKPMLDYDKQLSYIARDASPLSFGHSGFTGTFVWADPEYDLLFIFLSNRVHPYRSHRKLYEMNIRPKIHQLAYDVLIHKKI